MIHLKLKALSCWTAKRLGAFAIFASLLVASSGTAQAHPHAFVDGGVDFVIGTQGGQATLDALQVTWLLDEFETLYMLSAAEVGLNTQGELDPADHERFERRMRAWLSDFAGSAHASLDGQKLSLHAASAIEVAIVEGRLKVTFDRQLVQPLSIVGRRVDVDFYEATYFYAHTVTQPSVVRGESNACATRVIPFDADEQASAMQAQLQRLAREEEPTNSNVGALFADRIVLQCA